MGGAVLTAADLAPVFGADEHPGQRQLTARQVALHRAHALKLLTDAKWVKTATPDAKAWARHWASRSVK